jgi:hypothetical protein
MHFQWTNWNLSLVKEWIQWGGLLQTHTHIEQYSNLYFSKLDILWHLSMLWILWWWWAITVNSKNAFGGSLKIWLSIMTLQFQFLKLTFEFWVVFFQHIFSLPTLHYLSLLNDHIVEVLSISFIDLIHEFFTLRFVVSLILLSVELLDLAYDLGNRLLMAFNTSTTIPFGTVIHSTPLETFVHIFQKYF